MGIVLIIVGLVMMIAGFKIVTSKEEPVQKETATAKTTVSSRPTLNPQRAVEPEKPVLTAKEKGNEFEDFVVNLLADWRFRLLDRTQDAVSSSGVVAESCKNPDLHVEQKRNKDEIDYYLECKYRSSWRNGAVEFEEWQLNRYRQFQKDHHRKVLIALGVGGTPSSPDTFMLVPLDSIRNNTIQQIKTEFALTPTSDSLADYMNAYFSKVFAKSSKR